MAQSDADEAAILERIVEHVQGFYKDRNQGEIDTITRVAEMRRLVLTGACVGGAVPLLQPSTRVIPARDGGLTGEWVLAAGADPRRRLLYIHGGGWVSGAPSDYRHMMEAFSTHLRAAVFAVDYRLAPEAPWPAAPDDCLAAWQAMVARGPAGPLAADALWLAGDSAGGNLALVLLQDLKAGGGRLPVAVATMGAATDFALRGESYQSKAAADPMINRDAAKLMRSLYLPAGSDLADPRISPAAGDLSGLPPTLLHVGEREVLLDDSLSYGAKAEAAGSPASVRVWPGMIHVFEWWCHLLPSSRRALMEMATFLDSHAAKA